MLGSVGSLRKLSGGFFCQHYKAIQRVTRAYDQILIPVLRQNLIPTVHTEKSNPTFRRLHLQDLPLILLTHF
jgi:hypothetical protein